MRYGICLANKSRTARTSLRLDKLRFRDNIQHEQGYEIRWDHSCAALNPCNDISCSASLASLIANLLQLAHVPLLTTLADDADAVDSSLLSVSISTDHKYA